LRNGDWRAAEPWLEEAVQFLQPVPSGLTIALILKGDVDAARHHFDEAESSYRRGLQLGRELGSHQLINRALRRLASSQQRNGQLDAAIEMLMEALELARQTGDSFGIADFSAELAAVLIETNSFTDAQTSIREGLTEASRISNSNFLCRLGLLQARLWMREGRHQRADEMLLALDAEVPADHALRTTLDEALASALPTHQQGHRPFSTLLSLVIAGVT
ncbi:MAG: tetratricopeptide repeat protein, partial [Myxococcota bacterium]